MAILKCKMCGGDMNISEDKTFGTCEYCGCVMTLPKVSDEQRAAAFNRGNHFRRSGEFDKALAVYERIVAEDDTDAEAHWCCALCRFGIEYVEDPATYEWLPTCHRASFTSFLEDVDYLAAVEHSDGLTKRQYQKDGAKIAEVQKGILATSQNEKPFDVFICYKETGEDGQRTRDSLMAQDIYYQLTEQGRRVFFARITLEDKGGAEYEPYIFAALNSAKVMVVVGTKPEHFNAVWVKNEWSRFLSMMKKDRTKLLLPCYRDMDPYDLPEALSVLQSYDMSKIGFIQDLIRGVNKVLEAEKPKEIIRETIVERTETGGNTTSLLKRAFMFLEDGNWTEADAYCEKVLDIDPESAEAYLGKLMAELRVKTRDGLRDCAEPFDGSNNYQKVLRFGDEKLVGELKGYIKFINDRKEQLFSAVAKAFTEKLNGRKSVSEKELLAEAKKDAESVTEVIRIFDDTQSEMENAKRQKDSLQSKIESLKAARSSLGLFAGKEKKQLSSEIAEAEQALSECDKTVLLLQKKLQGYKSKQHAESRLAELHQSIRNMEEAIEKAQENGTYSLTYEEALKAVEDEKIWREFITEYPRFRFLLSKTGDIISFGNYYLQNKTTKEPIKWRILAKEDNRILVISEYALDRQQYNTSDTDVTWESCTLRTWMNGTFLNAAFSAEEQSIIQSTTVSADKNPNYGTNPGNATTDKVFLLSTTEAEEYFSTDSARQCKPTEYAVANGAYVNSGNGNCWWWLRWPGDGRSYAVGVGEDGAVDYDSLYVVCDNDCVRPALWINLDS